MQFPEVGESDILKWVGNTAYQRGYRYFEDEAILNPRRRGYCLISECQGTQPTPYRVEIRLGPNGIEEGSCSCPGGDGGHCKHAAALLLTWLNEPDLFVEVPELEQLLEERSKAELISIIQEMVARHPDLEQLLELSALSNLPQGESIQPDLIAQQIRRAFSTSGGESGDHSRIAEGLQAILDLGEDLLDRQDIHNAATVYETLLEGMLAFENSLYDDQGGELGQVLAECEQGIQQCLESTSDSELRQGLLHTLFDFYLWDLQAGGLGYADETPATLTGQATDEEKAMIAGWIQAELPEGEDWDEGYQRRALGGLWLNLVAGSLDDETYLRICRQTGRTRDLVRRLIRLDRVEEALAAASAAGSAQLTSIADLFEESGLPELGKQLIQERPNSATEIQYLEWLKQYALRHDRPEEALRLADSLFWQAQSLENYNDLLEAAAALGQQDAVRDSVLQRLESAGNFSLMVEIFLLENEIDQALSALERVSPELWMDRLAGLRRQVARAIEVARPREAIRQYLLLAEELIEQRSRGSYAEASRLLQEVRKLYQNLGEEDRSESLIRGLRQEYRRLPVLLDEMRRAGL
jgi:uncharacterized Zn finger protein